MTRVERYVAIMTSLGRFDMPEEVIEPMPRRFLLIERFRAWRDHDAWPSTHDSIEEACLFNDFHETGYIPELLVDLDTGDEYQPECEWSFHPSMKVEPEYECNVVNRKAS